MRAFKYFVTPLVVLAALILSPALMADDPLPEAQDVLAKALEASGGKEAYGKIKSRVSESKMVMAAMGMEATAVSYNDGTNNRENVVMEGLGNFVSGRTGDIVWAMDPMTGARVLKGVERAVAMRSARLHPMLDLNKFYKEMKVDAVEKVGDVDCYKVAMTPNEGRSEFWFFDKNTHLMTRMKMTVEGPMGVIAMTMDMSDYREVDGLKVPFVIKIDQGMQKFEIVTTKVEHNLEIAADKFALPTEITALVEKAKAKAAEKAGEEKKEGEKVGG